MEMKSIHELYNYLCFNTQCNEIDYDTFKTQLEMFIQYIDFRHTNKTLAVEFVQDYLFDYTPLPKKSVYDIMISMMKDYFNEMRKEK
jgi:hypothetical protein